MTYGKPHRQFGMTRPAWLPVVLVVLVVTVFLAIVASVASLIAWVLWSLGGVLVGAVMMAFDKKSDGG